MPPKKKTSPLAFTVLIGPWYADGEGPFADDVELEEASPELVRLAHHAHAAGVIRISDETIDDPADHGVQSQEDGEAALAEAMGEWVEPTTRDDGTTEPGYWTGPWLEGHLMAVEAPGKTNVHVDVDEPEEES